VLSRSGCRFCSSLLFVAISCFAVAQSPMSMKASEYSLLTPVTTISKQVNEVNLAFTITDKHGHFVSNLQPQDFQLLDNQLVPVRFNLFQQRSDLPLHLAVLIDASSSVTHRFKMEQDAALAFIKKILRPGKDEAMVIAFNDRVTLIQNLTGRAASVSGAVAKVRPDGNTALFDAVIYAADHLRRMPESGITRRAIVLVSDGVDTVGRSTLAQAQAAAARAEATIFSLSSNISTSGPEEPGDKCLKQLSSFTGGVMLPASDEARLSSSFRNIEKALHSQYVVAYSPPEFHADGTYHKVEIVPAKK
jgi:VWFA-related protein